SGMALLILALLQRIFLMSSLMLLLVWLIFFMVLIKLLPILGTISGKTVKLMVLALICLGNNRHSTRNKTRDGLIRVRNIRALNGRFNTSITHAYSIVIGSKHITLNATGGGFLTASKQFRHGA